MWPPIEMPDSKSPSTRFSTSSGPKPVSQNRMPAPVHHERRRRGDAEDAAARAAGERVRRRDRARPPRRRAPTRSRSSRSGSARSPARTPCRRSEHEHVEADVQQPEVHDRVGAEPPPLAVVQRRADRARGSCDVVPLPLDRRRRAAQISTNTATLSADEHLRRDQRVALRSSGGCARCPWAAPARTHSKHCEPTAAWVRQSGHAGRPQRVQARPVSRS